eukprot:jgi/Phyca11/108643/e_gw1.15.666.1
MAKLSLSCVIVGLMGSAFSVDIDADQFVGDLKKIIQKKKNDLHNVDADKLQLFLAKKDKGWLPDKSEAALELKKGEVHEDIQVLINGEEMEATKTLNYWLFEKNQMEEQLSSEQIHVLVVVPEIRDGKKRYRSSLWFAESEPLKKRRVKTDESEDEDDDVSEERTFFQLCGCPPMAHPARKDSKLMERKAYTVIFAQLVEHVKDCFEFNRTSNNPGLSSNVVVTGNPGIGKSWFYLYCIFQLIRNREREDIKQLPPYELVMNYDDNFVKYDAARAEFVRLNKEDVDDLMDKPFVLRLVDARSTKLMGWRGVSVLFAVPDAEDLHDFEKVPGPKFIMPAWSLEELQDCNQVLPDDLKLAEDELVSRFDAFGGIPRYVFSKNKTAIENKLKRAMASFSVKEILSYCKRGAAVKESDQSDCVLQMVPSEANFRLKFYLDFLSSDICEKIVFQAEGEDLTMLAKFAMGK